MSKEKLRKKMFNLILDCLITVEVERTAEKVMYGNPNYWVDKIMEIHTREQIELIEKMKKEVIGEDDGVMVVDKKDAVYHLPWRQGRMELRAEQRSKLEDLKKTL